MSIEAAKAFTERVENDEQLQAQVEQATSSGQEDALAKVIEIGSGAGFEFSGEELREATSELGDEELDAAAGGVGELSAAAGSGDAKPMVYLKYKLDRCFVKSWSTSGDAD